MKKEKKRKLKVLNLFIFLINFSFFLFLLYLIYNLPIKNIYVINNNILSDQEIIDIAKIRNYPRFIISSKNRIKNNILKLDVVKSVEVKKTFKREIIIEIKEARPLFYILKDNKTIFDNNKKIDINLNKPILVNNINQELTDKLINKFIKLDDEVINKISEIKYDPNDIDKERFFITMDDNNYVYLTLYTFEKINNYNKIIEAFPEEKGILYLDVGNYFEVLK
jgi:cell division septal protein FtsQ